MICVWRAVCPLVVANTRYGHMVRLPGNVWSQSPWIRAFKKKKYKKGTCGLRLDTIKPHNSLLYRWRDPRKELYAYQIDPYPRTRSSDPLPALCSLTKTAEPVSLEEIRPDSVSEAHLDAFVEHAGSCCDIFNSLYHDKGVPVDPVTPIEVDKFSEHYSASFLHNLVNFLYKDDAAGPLITQNSFLTFSQHTGAFWRRDPATDRKTLNNFQFMNFIDLALRTTSHISYEGLRKGCVEAVALEEMTKTCVSKLHLFKEIRKIHQYPGFLKESLFPHNHTVFKVVNRTLSDRSLQAVAMMTGFGQTFATVQYQIDFTCHVDLIPVLQHPETVHVVVTDGQRYCLGIYQCNDTNLDGTQMVTKPPNMCALSPVQRLLEDGQINRSLLSGLLGMLTYDQDQCTGYHMVSEVNHDML